MELLGVFPLLVVRINGTLIARDDLDRAQVPDEFDVQVVHLMSCRLRGPRRVLLDACGGLSARRDRGRGGPSW
ncbi:MAG: hypothetical protein HY901_35100 [Deltaproteobacteria bacterium]|nr:hypothetical protein [Deltaproteobacteria bacterium]